MSKTTIQWTDESWNPIVGCTRVSEGCRNCYAFALHDMRHEAYQNGKQVPEQYAKPFTEIQLMPTRLQTPLSRKKPTKWFVNSMSDLFHPDVPFDFIDRVFATMYDAQWHTFQILTKRPERAAEYLNSPSVFNHIAWHTWRALKDKFPSKAKLVSPEEIEQDVIDCWPLRNVWIGTSVEDQKSADRRIPELLKCPAAIRFLSCEPLLGPLDLHPIINSSGEFKNNQGINCDWVIIGGESGKGARECHLNWIRSIVNQCQEAGVACFVKQLGALPLHPANVILHPPQDRAMKLKDSHGGNWDEWPEDLRVREFPQEAT